jgi:hypothetical protein
VNARLPHGDHLLVVPREAISQIGLERARLLRMTQALVTRVMKETRRARSEFFRNVPFQNHIDEEL